MKRSILLCALVLSLNSVPSAWADDAAAPASAATSAVKGSMLVSASGARLAPVYRVGPDGSAQIILEGRLVTVPVATLSMAAGRLTTSLSKSEVLALH